MVGYKRRSRPVINIVFTFTVITILLATLIFTLKLSVYRVETGSMAPDIPVGAFVVDSALAPVALHHAITFEADSKTVTHVLVGKNQDGSLITRGISNSSNDVWRSPVHPADVKGRVVFSILLFSPAFVSSWQGMVFAISAIVLILIFIMWLWVRERRRIAVT